jgi:hypothetical protein
MWYNDLTRDLRTDGNLQILFHGSFNQEMLRGYKEALELIVPPGSKQAAIVTILLEYIHDKARPRKSSANGYSHFVEMLDILNTVLELIEQN